MRPAVLGKALPTGLLVVASAAAAGGEATAQLSVGVMAGLNRSMATGSGSSGADARTGFMVGGTTTVLVAETFSLRPELYLSTKGSRFRTGPAGSDVRTMESVSVEIPLLAQLHTGPSELVRPHLLAGVSLGLTVRCRIDGADCSNDASLTRRAWEAGVVMGAELEVGRTAFGARYEAGLRPVGKFTWGTEIFDGVLSFTARYFLYSRSERVP